MFLLSRICSFCIMKEKPSFDDKTSFLGGFVKMDKPVERTYNENSFFNKLKKKYLGKFLLFVCALGLTYFFLEKFTNLILSEQPFNVILTAIIYTSLILIWFIVVAVLIIIYELKKDG